MNYLNEYKKIFPKNPIYVFSALPDDRDSLDKVDDLKRIRLDEKFIETALELDDFRDSMIVFDDIDGITNKPLKMKIIGILDNCIKLGRHQNISIIYTTHTACNGNETKQILNSSHLVVFFKNGLGDRAKKYLLGAYYGLDRDAIKNINTLQSRWVAISRTFPMICWYEKGAFQLNN
jgi:hypothetical protein